ncbi:MAG: aminoglycoside phosphotransferase family protein [Planctomycetes bacterium]|nr:aminoglycoside phosphotransferase family protein [Planctomycetota bacterium]
MTDTADQPAPTDHHLLSLAHQMWQFDAQQRVDPGGSCRVWSGISSDGCAAFLKWHPQQRSFRQEEQALLHWLPHVPGDLAHRPGLLESNEEEKLLLISAVPGEPVESGRTSEQELPLIHRQAGLFLRKLHRLEVVDEDPVTLSTALPERLQGWIDKADGVLKDDQIVQATKCIGDGSLFANDRRVACHNDYQPRNWLWDGQRLGIIDLEHAHLNHPGFDLVRLQVGIWKESPQLRESFLDGYGQNPDWLDDERMDAIITLFGVGCIVWGTQHQQPDLVVLGRRCLA